MSCRSLRRPRGGWARFLALEDEDEHGESSGHGGSPRGARWPRECGGALRRVTGDGEIDDAEGARARGERGRWKGPLWGVAWRALRDWGGLEEPRRRAGVAGSLPARHRAGWGRRQGVVGLGRGRSELDLRPGRVGLLYFFYFFLLFFSVIFVVPRNK